uniref:TLE family member 3, transcriptional corepressor n=1 Tax=Neogobius melanostomus TaxID=47308 RepID=A0A8C6UZ04_9GOBI
SNLHYLYYEMSYGLNIEMHKQVRTELWHKLFTAFFSLGFHQQQVAQAVERAKQVTMTELNAIIGVRGLPNLPLTVPRPPVQLPPHPSGLQPPGLPPVTGAGSGLLALGALGSQAHLPVKDEKNHHDLEHRGEPGTETGDRDRGQRPGTETGDRDHRPGSGTETRGQRPEARDRRPETGGRGQRPGTETGDRDRGQRPGTETRDQDQDQKRDRGQRPGRDLLIKDSYHRVSPSD